MLINFFVSVQSSDANPFRASLKMRSRDPFGKISVMIVGFTLLSKSVGLYPINLTIVGEDNCDIILISRVRLFISSSLHSLTLLIETFAA